MGSDPVANVSEREAVLAGITSILRELAEEDDIVLTYETTASDVEAWDSLMHVNLIIALESHFKIRFAAKEITSAANVGELVDIICGKLAK